MHGAHNTCRNACILSAKNAHALVHVCICNGAEASLTWKLLRTYLESCTSIMQTVVCCPLLPPVLLSRPNPSPDAIRSRNPLKSTLAHDAVATVVSRKHHSIIRVGAGLIQFCRPDSQQSSMFAIVFVGFFYTLNRLFYFSMFSKYHVFLTSCKTWYHASI